MLAGLTALPAGRRRTRLERVFNDEVLPLFAGRVLPFDKRAAHAFARMSASSRKAGRPLSFADGAIAAIAAAHDFMIATRNVPDFEATGVGVLNPWQVGG